MGDPMQVERSLRRLSPDYAQKAGKVLSRMMRIMYKEPLDVERLTRDAPLLRWR